jgi:hypothetical protein
MQSAIPFAFAALTFCLLDERYEEQRGKLHATIRASRRDMPQKRKPEKPNTLVIWGDEIRISNATPMA